MSFVPRGLPPPSKGISLSTLSTTPVPPLSEPELAAARGDLRSTFGAEGAAGGAAQRETSAGLTPIDLIYRGVARIGLPSWTQVRSRLTSRPGFHLQMAYASVFLLTLVFTGCRLMSIRLNEPTDALIAVAIVIVATMPLPLYWHEKGKLHLRDAAFAISWAFLFTACIPFTVAIAARAGAPMPLQDLRFAQLDQSMGISVPYIMAFADRLGVSNAINHTYVWLEPFLAISFLLPALTGKVLPARRFVTSNLIAFAIGLPLFLLLPAVGPWSGYHFPPGIDRYACEAGLLQLRQPGPYIFHPAGVVCFPSFHVIWAILAAHTLWCFRWLRMPALLLAGLIILSTMTLGWHYFVDVLAGMVVAATAVMLSRSLPQ